MPQRLLALLATVVTVGLVAIGCNGCDGFDTEPDPWKVSGNEAPYQMIFPGQWTAEPPESINPGAEVAASLDDTFFVIVIPQELPSFPEPDVFSMKDRALTMLDDSVDDLVIDRQGPLELDGVSGLTVFATGDYNGTEISYITSYAVYDGFGFQIIGFSDAEHSEELFDEIDTLLTYWRFLGDDSSDTDSDTERTEEEMESQTGPLEQADELGE